MYAQSRHHLVFGASMLFFFFFFAWDVTKFTCNSCPKSTSAAKCINNEFIYLPACHPPAFRNLRNCWHLCNFQFVIRKRQFTITNNAFSLRVSATKASRKRQENKLAIYFTLNRHSTDFPASTAFAVTDCNLIGWQYQSVVSLCPIFSKIIAGHWLAAFRNRTNPFHCIDTVIGVRTVWIIITVQ